MMYVTLTIQYENHVTTYCAYSLCIGKYCKYTIIVCVSRQAYIRAGFQHVVSVPSRDGHKGHSVRVITNFLDVSADFLHNLFVALLAVVGLSGIHLVDAHNELLHSQGVGKESMFTSLPVL